MNYAEKLRDPRWQKIRLEVMQRDNFTCRNCGCKTKELQIHHLRYHIDPWLTPVEFLETLCCDCHSEREAKNKILCSSIKAIETQKLYLGFDSIAYSISAIQSIE